MTDTPNPETKAAPEAKAARKTKVVTITEKGAAKPVFGEGGPAAFNDVIEVGLDTAKALVAKGFAVAGKQKLESLED